MGDALEEMKDDIKLSQNNVSHAGEFRRNLGQPELDLLSDESVFPCLRTSISPFFGDLHLRTCNICLHAGSLKLELRHGEGYGSNEECKSLSFNMVSLATYITEFITHCCHM
jgi:hypothetical protein